MNYIMRISIPRGVELTPANVAQWVDWSERRDQQRRARRRLMRQRRNIERRLTRRMREEAEVFGIEGSQI